MHFANHRDFYQKALLPIGKNDQQSLGLHETAISNQSYWLIALEGSMLEAEKEFYTWKITIHQANIDGLFHANKALYTSESYDCFHKAYEDAKKIENICVNDCLASSKYKPTLH